MKREVYVTMTMTKDEMRDLISKMRNKEDEDGKRYTTSSFLREFVIKPYLNGGSSPPQETVIETVIETVNEPEPETPNSRWDDIKF